MFKFFEIKIKGFKMQMQEVIEKLKDILASEGKRYLKTKNIAKEWSLETPFLIHKYSIFYKKEI